MEEKTIVNKTALRRLVRDKLDQISNEINKQMFDGLGRGVCDRQAWIDKNCKLQSDLQTLELLFKEG